MLPEKLGGILNRQVALEKVRFNPYSLSITLEKLQVSDAAGGLFAGVDRFYANLQASSLFRWGAVFREIRIEGLAANIVRTGKRDFNFSDLIPETAPSPEPADGKTGPPRFAVQQLSVTVDRIEYVDRFAGSRHRVEAVDLTVADLSSLPTGVGKELSAKLQAAVDDAAISVDATAAPFDAAPSVKATVSIDNLNIPRYLAYLPARPAAELESAQLAFTLDISYRPGENGPGALTVSGPVRLTKVEITDAEDRPMLRLPEVAVRIAESDLFSPELVVEEVRVDSPESVVVRNRGGALNLLDLVPELPESGGTRTGEETGARFSLQVKTSRISNGTVRFADRVPAGGFETVLSGIDLSLDHFSLAPENRADYRLAFITAAEESATVEGGFSLSPLQTEASFEIRDIELARYVPYVADLLRVEIQGGRLSAGGRLVYADRPEGPDVAIEQGEVALRSLVLYRDEDRDRAVSVPQLDVRGVSFSLADRDLSVEEVSSEKGEIHYLRFDDGRINLLQLVKLPEDDGASVKPAEPEGPFRFFIDRIQISGYRVLMEDRVPVETVQSTLSDLQLVVDGLTNRAGETALVTFGFLGGRGGSIDLGGDLGLNPLTVNFRVAVNGAVIRAFQPYFTDRVKIIVTGGTASADGRFTMNAVGEGMPEIRYTGRVEINGFKSVDKEDTLEFIDWESLFAANLDFSMPPLTLVIEEVGLTGLYSRLIIDEDGTINVIDALSTEEDAAASTVTEGAQPSSPAAARKIDQQPEPATQAERPYKIEVRTVTLQNGHINFTDLFNPFNFDGDLTRIGGRVSGLTSLESGKADVLLQGSWENRAPLEITGKINPLAKKRYADLTLTIRDIDLSPFSPYSGKFLGYKLEKGLLTLELGYLLEGTHLKGDNRAHFEELTLGERVESASSVTLPVALAVTLLKGPDGDITLDVPVEGDLDDPQFSLGRTILRVLGNLIVKIISAPFAFLGNLVGGEEELSFIDFAPGSARISPEAEEKIDSLITAMIKRPGVRLNIQGNADPRDDPEAIRRRKFENLIRSQKLREMTGSGQTAVPLDEIEISPEVYPRYLKKAYDTAPFTKPRDADGNIKQLPPEEMEKLLLTQFVISEGDLRQLAVERADHVKTRMLESGQIATGRLFIIEPQIRADADDPEASGKSQVRFSLR